MILIFYKNQSLSPGHRFTRVKVIKLLPRFRFWCRGGLSKLIRKLINKIVVTLLC